MDRYLPEAAWALLTEADQKEADQTKADVDDMGEQVAEWPDKVKRTMVKIGATDGDDGPTKDELYEPAQELDVDGRFQMNKDELKAAIIEKYTASSS